MNDNPVPSDYYVLGETREADDALWTASGFGGPALTEFYGLNSSYRVTGKQALEQAAALICVDVLAQDISKATLQLKEKVSGGKGERTLEAGDHRIAEILALEPNERHTWPEFVAMMIYHLALASNSYAYIPRNREGDALGLVPAVPGHVQDRVNERTGEVFYDIQASTAQEAALLGFQYRTVPERDVLHIRQRMLDGFFGYSTLVAGGRTLSLSRELEDYERNLYSEHGLVRGAFVRSEKAGALTDDGFRRLNTQLKKLMQRVRTQGDPILLEDGITYQDIAMNADEAQMAQALDKQIEMICKLWRMPPHKAMHLASVKYENLATLEMVYVRDTLVPICRLIEARLNKALLTRKERLTFRLEFNRDEMSIVDEKLENDRVTKLVQAGVISHNEARRDQGYNPRPNGDVYSMPVNTVLLDGDNKIVASGAKATGDKNASDTPSAEDAAPEKGLRLAVNND